jgi:uncharacterized damage-inducible protein DinB
MNATDILKYGQGTVFQTIEGFPESEWETSGACGVWSVKDIIAHLTSYEHVLAEVLTAFVTDGSSTTSAPNSYLSKFTDPNGNFNDSEVAARKEKTIRDVLGEFNDTQAQVMSMIAQIPPETLRQVGTLPWYGSAYSLDDFLVYAFYGHKREHSAQIAAFRDHLR